MKYVRWSLVFLCMLFLNGCGQTGPLYLPKAQKQELEAKQAAERKAEGLAQAAAQKKNMPTTDNASMPASAS